MFHEGRLFASNSLATSDPVCRCAYRCAFPTAYMFAGSFPHFVEVDEVCVGEGFSCDGFGIMIGWIINRRCFLQWLCWVTNVYIHHQGDLAKLVKVASQSGTWTPTNHSFFESLFLFTTKQPKSTWFQPNGVLSLRLSCSFPAFFVYKDFGWFHIEQKTLNTWRLSCLGDVVSFPRSVVGFRKNTGDLPSARGGWRYLWIHWSLGVFVRCEES